MTATELHPEHNLSESWSNVMAISRRIQTLANDQAWEDMIAATRQRHQVVVSHFQRFPVNPENAVFYMENLNEFMQYEERLQILVKQAKQETIQAVSQLNKSRQAVNAYHSA
jgi:hypothetical protein